MTQRYQSAGAVLLRVKEKLALAREAKPEEILDAVAATLATGRGYPWTGIYLAIGDLGVQQAASGPAPSSIGLGDVRSEIVVPIRLGARTLGVIVAETGRGVAGRERALLQQVAKLVAQYLTTDRSKQLLRKMRERNKAEASADRPHKSPQSARPAVRKAAAGETIPR